MLTNKLGFPDSNCLFCLYFFLFYLNLHKWEDWVKMRRMNKRRSHWTNLNESYGSSLIFDTFKCTSKEDIWIPCKSFSVFCLWSVPLVFCPTVEFSPLLYPLFPKICLLPFLSVWMLLEAQPGRLRCSKSHDTELYTTAVHLPCQPSMPFKHFGCYYSLPVWFPSYSQTHMIKLLSFRCLVRLQNSLNIKSALD